MAVVHGPGEPSVAAAFGPGETTLEGPSVV